MQDPSGLRRVCWEGAECSLQRLGLLSGDSQGGRLLEHRKVILRYLPQG